MRGMHELQLLSFMYDCQNHLASTHFHSYFTPSSEVHGCNTMLLLTDSAVHTRKYLLWRHAVRTERSKVRAAWRHNKYFPYGPNSRLIRALLYTHTSKTTKSQCFPLLLWTEVQPVHTPVRMQAYGPALSQSNFSILSVFYLVYNNRLASRGDLFLTRKLHSSMELGQFSIQVQGFGTQFLYFNKRISLPDNFRNKTWNIFSVQLSTSFLSLFSPVAWLVPGFLCLLKIEWVAQWYLAISMLHFYWKLDYFLHIQGELQH